VAQVATLSTGMLALYERASHVEMVARCSPGPNLDILHIAEGSGRRHISEIAGHQRLQHVSA